MRFANPLGLDAFELIVWLVEFAPHVITTLIALYFVLPTGGSATKPNNYARNFVAFFVPGFIAIMTTAVFISSWEDAYVRGYEIFKYPSLRSQLEDYIVTGNGDLNDILESDKYAPTFGLHEVSYLLRDLIRHSVVHSDNHNEDNIDEGYNKGNDWFSSMLGPTMMYTSGLYPKGTETLEEAQDYKIDYVANAIQLEPGMSILDIGCGWTYLAKRMTEVHGANVTGITLSKEQRKWGLELNKDNDVTIHLQNAMTLAERDDLPPEGFDRVTSLEMAEHVGIRRYQEFLKMVHGMMKDDGVFYFQVAGLRRAWRYEDIVWGLFMGEHVFPGADASTPIGWVSTQVERAGFEVQRVHNMGSHYSRTLYHWLVNWRSNKEYVEKKYSPEAYRRWEVFLAWSVRVARQGSSTLFMLTLTKAGVEDRRIKSQAHLVPKYIQQKPEEMVQNVIEETEAVKVNEEQPVEA